MTEETPRLPLYDFRDSPDLPSVLTLRELTMVNIFAQRYALEESGDLVVDDGTVEVAIIVRDRGRDGEGLRASWVEFEVVGRKFAMWRETLDLYEVGEDGAVGDEPIHYGQA